MSENTRISYWAQVWMPGHHERCTEGCEHVLASPGFDSQGDLVAWLRPYTTPAYTFKMIRRESEKESHTYTDFLLEAEPSFTAAERRANGLRLAALLNATLNHTAMPEPDGVLLPADDSEPF